MKRAYVVIALNVLTAIILATYRIAGHRDQLFQAAAHLYVGGAFGAWLSSRGQWVYLFLGLALSVVETICFLRDKGIIH